MKRLLKVFFLVLVPLLTLDIILSSFANKHIRKADYYLDDLLKKVELGPDQGKRFICQFDTVFHIYVYKTCFSRQTNRGIKDWLYTFHYARPFPIFLAGRRQDSLRFEMITTFNARAKIYSNGTIEKVN